MKGLIPLTKKNKRNILLEINSMVKSYKGNEVNEFLDELKITLDNIEEDFIFDYGLQKELEKAVEERSLTVFYQPKVDLVEKKTEYEALVRWIHPLKGIIPPNNFIPQAEKTYLINNITEFVLNEALDFSHKIDSKISVNISPSVFQDENYFKKIYNKLIESKYRSNIIFEITEGVAIVNMKKTIEKIEKNRKTKKSRGRVSYR